MDWEMGLMFGIGLVLGIIILALLFIGRKLEDNDKQEVYYEIR